MTGPVQAVIFDFDGLIVDTEMPEYLAWQAVYARYGWTFPLASWLRNVGRNDSPFDPLRPFREAGGLMGPGDARALWQDEHARLEREYLKPLPGVIPLLDRLAAGGIRAAVASSSRRLRVRHLLSDLRLDGRFDALACGDEVPLAKPAPDVYLLAATRLAVPPRACVALEDSEPGVRAAKAAGMPCIAVPSHLTRTMDFSAADLIAPSLLDVSLDTIARVARGMDPVPDG
ncbi:MAG TPA: HAD-IA family hydrolase [bacterium]|nr:HAD-IA family hydrolase [bacterium]